MKDKVLFFVVCLLLSIGSSNAFAVDAAHKLSILSANGKMHDFTVELAISPDQQEHGLMNQTEMKMDSGMLFVFQGEDERSFWMKNTLIPLDMIFIRKNGIIHHIHENAVPNDLTSIESNGPVAAVLEVNGGVCAAMGIKKGDKVVHSFFKE